jgi:hypothetical protein
MYFTVYALVAIMTSYRYHGGLYILTNFKAQLTRFVTVELVEE